MNLQTLYDLSKEGWTSINKYSILSIIIINEVGKSIFFQISKLTFPSTLSTSKFHSPRRNSVESVAVACRIDSHVQTFRCTIKVKNEINLYLVASAGHRHQILFGLRGGTLASSFQSGHVRQSINSHFHIL